MKSHCLSFTQVPHTTQLFTDYLSWNKVHSFYPRPPHFSSWVQEAAGQLQYDSGRRNKVTDVLERQNKAWGASEKTFENLARLRSGAAAMVTGQQVVLYGGPILSIYKALTAAKLAAHATQAGVDTVPVFWLATQDHDLAEVNHVSLPGTEEGLQVLETSTQGVPGAPVGQIAFGPEIIPVVEAAAATLGDSSVTEMLKAAYRPGETFGGAFARLFTRLFAEFGLVFLDPSDPELNSLAGPVYCSAIEGTVELDAALLERGEELVAAGYHQQVKVGPPLTLLFWVRDGVRTPIHRTENSGEFVVGKEIISQADLLAKIRSQPHQFSPNALLRPVVQDHLLPTLAYSGGPAEVAYFAQAAIVYEKLLGKVTPIIPRFSATIVEPRPQGLLQRYGLSILDVLQGPDTVRQELAQRALPKELHSAFDRAEHELKNSLATIREVMANLDKTLVDAAVNAEEKMCHQLEQLRARAARAELRQTETLGRHADLLSNALYPAKTLQERHLAGVYFMARYGEGFLRDVYDCISPECVDHQVLSF